MNKVILSGIISNNIESKGSTTPMAKFNLAVKRTNGTDFVPIVAWNQTAEHITEYCEKGSRLLVEGRLQVNEYEKDGQKKYSTEVIADRVEFLSKKETKPKETMPKFEYGKQMEIKDEDLPW